jgi:hypothetical protein
MGGAGVARPPAGTAAYWNPAALAFNESAFAAKIGAGAGLTLNNGLADNVDRLSELAMDAIENFSGNPVTDAAVASDVIQAIAILDKLARDEGALTVRAHGVAGFHIKRLGFGVFGSFEGAALPNVDTTNVVPENGGAPVTAADLDDVIGAAGGAPDSNAFFSPDQRAALESALAAAGVQNEADVVDVFDAQLATSNPTGVTTDEALAGLLALANTLAAGGPLDQNQSSLRNRALGLVEVPLAYGLPVSLGRFGTLGIGASAKLLRGRVYLSEIPVFGTSSDEIFDELREQYEDSAAFGLDAGLLYRPWDVLAIGVVGKHLNKPAFKSPGGMPDYELDPQVRAGVAVTPLSWVTLMADLDLTENETALPGYKSRVLGGGLELHPLSSLKLRAGAYKNLAESDISPVVTAGLSIGIPWVYVDVDGAAALDTAKYDGEEYPEEARLQASLNIRF